MAEKKSYKEQIMEELFNIGEYDLADAIDNLQSDKDVKEYIWANRGYFDKTIDAAALKDAPNFRSVVYGQMPSSEVQLDKEFGKDWDKDFVNIPYNKIAYVAEQHGIDPKELNKQMAVIATQNERYRIAHGEDLGGWFDSPASFAHNLGGAAMSLFGRRAQEAIARGEEPSYKDMALDAGESALYAVPYGNALKGVKVGGKVGAALTGKAAQTALTNTVAPVVTEAADAALYSDDNPRGDFSMQDVGTGVATNYAAPWVLKRLMGRGGQIAQANVPFKEPAQTLTREEIEAQMNAKMQPQSWAQRNNTIMNKGGSLTSEQAEQALKFNKEYKAKYDKALEKIRKGEALKGDEAKFAEADPDLKRYIHRNEAPTNAQVLGKEGAQTWLTNEYGSLGEQNSPFYTRIPVAGSAIDKYVKEKEQEQAQTKKQKEIEDKWNIRLRQREWEAGFVPKAIEGDPIWEAYKQWKRLKEGK